jgi:hypothetical protein
MTWKKTPCGAWHFPAPGFEVKVTEAGGWFKVAVLHTETGTSYSPPAPFGDLTCACERALNELHRMIKGEPLGGTCEDEKKQRRYYNPPPQPEEIEAASPQQIEKGPTEPKPIWYEVGPALFAGTYKNAYLRCWKVESGWLASVSDSPKSNPYWQSQKPSSIRAAKQAASKRVSVTQGIKAKLDRKKKPQTETI